MYAAIFRFLRYVPFLIIQTYILHRIPAITLPSTF